MDQNQVQSENKNTVIHSVYEFLELFLISTCIVFLAFSFLGHFCVVSGESMEQTLYGGDRLLISDLFYEPTAGDVVVFQQPGDTSNNSPRFLIKRVIATEGQFVKIESHGVYVSDDAEFDETEKLDEGDYAYYENVDYMLDYYGIHGKTLEVPEDHVFVLGDNRNNSSDSRNPAIGFVDCRCITGKVILRFMPFSRFGTVH